MTAGCLPCCEGPTPGACACALYIPLGSTPDGTGNPPYASLSDAETAISDQVADCIAYAFVFDPSDLTSVAASQPAANQIDCDATRNIPGADNTNNIDIFFMVAAKAGETITANFTLTRTGGTISNDLTARLTLLDCALVTVLAQDTDTTSGVNTFTGTLSVTVPADGIYGLVASSSGETSITAGTIHAEFEIAGDDALIPQPVIALWDDSGTTRKLWACPKLLLPPLTESTGDWYADCAAADAVLTDPLQVSNCVGYYGGGSGNLPDTFAATDGGSSLSFSATWGSPTSGFGDCYGGVNAEAGETISFAFTGGTLGSADIYDDAGALVESIASGSSPITSAALPYTGRYTFRVRTFVFIMDPPFTSASITATSSGAMSVNPIQALYDVGLTCPARLNCGDSCP